MLPIFKNMAAFNLSIPHTLSPEEALSRIQSMLGEVRNEHADKIENLQEEWNGPNGTFSFTTKGFKISGVLSVTPKTIELNGQVPFAVSLFKGKITKLITEKATVLLRNPLT